MEEGDSPGDGTDLSEQGDQSSGTSVDDEASYCNPEPPPELEGQLLNADNIGETVFSKHWLFTTLMKLIQVIDGQENNKDDAQSGSEHDLDIDNDLQDELCKLWDMSMNPEVVKFLQEFKAIDILTGVIAKSRAPRATEICIGILGNMACNEGVCVTLAENAKLVKLLLFLLENSDAPTLVELTRLLHVCVSSRKAGSTWITAIKNDPSVFTHVSFILQSSTNNELIRNTADFLDKAMDLSDDITHKWSSGEVVLCCLEASKQVGCEAGSESLETFFHILQLVSTCEPGVEALVSYGAELINLVMKYLLSVCDEEVIGVEGKENTLGSALSIINILVASWEDRTKFVQEDFQLMRCVLKILEEVYPKYNARLCAGVRRHRSKSEIQSSPPPYSPYITGSQDSVSHRSSSKPSNDKTGESQKSSSLELEGSSLSHDASQQSDRDPEKSEKTDSNASVSHNVSQKSDMEASFSHDASQLTTAMDESSSLSQNASENVNAQSTLSNNASGLSGDVSKASGDIVHGRDGEKTTNNLEHLKEDVLEGSSVGGRRTGGSTPNNKGEDYEAKMMQMLYDVIQTCLVETTLVLKEIAIPKAISRKTRDMASTDEGITIDFEVGIPETLDYLDRKCPSPRLRFMFHILQDASKTEELDLLAIYDQLGKKFDTQKISRILAEF